MKAVDVTVPEATPVQDTSPSTSREPAPVGNATPPSRGEVARAVVDQVAQAVRAGGDGTIDVQLSPEELGRVRLTLTTLDGDLLVTIATDRAETLDLMRRHIDLLARDFRDQGYASVQFSFGQGGHHGPKTGSGGSGAAQDAEAAADAAAGGPDITGGPRNLPRQAGNDRLDLRL